MSRIKDVRGREVIDSRGNPTVEADVILENGQGTVTTFGEYEPHKFEESFRTFPKVVLRFGE